MKEKIIKFANRIYFGIYLCTRELDIPVIYMGRKDYYRGLLGFNICCLLIMFYVIGCISLIGSLGGEYLLTLIKGNFLYKLIYFVLLIVFYFLFSEYTSLEKEKGLKYFEEFDQEPRSKKMRWLLFSIFVFIVGFLFFLFGLYIFPVL